MCKDKFGGRKRVLRGGNWDVLAKWCSSADRFAYEPRACHDYIGFRVAKGPYRQAVRGGSMFSVSQRCRSADRGKFDPKNCLNLLSFRIARGTKHVQKVNMTEACIYRALRGGSWISHIYCRSTYRGKHNPRQSNYFMGFRIARSKHV